MYGSRARRQMQLETRVNSGGRPNLDIAERHLDNRFHVKNRCRRQAYTGQSVVQTSRDFAQVCRAYDRGGQLCLCWDLLVLLPEFGERLDAEHLVETGSAWLGAARAGGRVEAGGGWVKAGGLEHCWAVGQGFGEGVAAAVGCS